MKKSILGSLFNKFGLFCLASKINSPKITAIIFFLTCSIVKSKKRNAPTMIYIHKGIGIDDIKAMARPVLRHRLITNFNAEAEGLSTDDILSILLEDDTK